MSVVRDSDGQQKAEPYVGVRFGRPKSNLETRLRGTLKRVDILPIDTYKKMLMDETISAGLEFINLSVIGHMGPYTHPNSTIESAVMAMLHGMRKSFVQAIDEILTGVPFGFSATEIIVRPREGLLMVDDLSTFDQQCVEFKMETDHDDINFGYATDVVQSTSGVFSPLGRINVPMDKVIHFTHAGRYDNPYGTPRLRSIWPCWVVKDETQLSWGLGLEKFGTPTVIGRTEEPEFEVKIDDDGATLTQGEIMYNDLVRMLKSGVAVMGMNQEVELLETAASNIGDAFTKSQDHWNKCILRGLMLPSLLWEPTDIGSFALGSKHFEIFLRFIKRLMCDLQDVLLKQLVVPFIIWNFGHEAALEPGKFQVQFLDEAEVKVWADIYHVLTQNGYMTPTEQSDFDAVRERAGLDQRDAPEEAPEAEDADPNPDPEADRPTPRVPRDPNNPESDSMEDMQDAA